MTALLLIDALVALLWVVFCVRLPFAARQLPRARADAPGSTSAPRVSVIIPARDEELLLPRCLASIATQDVPIHETIVVDDDSNDSTARVASQGGAHVVAAGARPTGWAGKPWAAHVGSQEATGDWLLFVDADAVLAPQCVRAALADAEEHGADLLTLMPRPTCSTAFEAMVQPLFLMVTMGALNMKNVNDRKSPVAAAWGGFLLFRRGSYDTIGGHVGVKSEIIEDLMLARAIKGRGMKLRLLVATDLIEAARPQGARKGWDAGYRLVVGAMPRSVVLPAASAILVLVFFVGPYVLAPLGPWFAAVALLHLACVLVARVELDRACALDKRLALLQPVAALILAAVLLRATVAALGNDARIRWRRRQYPQ
jgi:hypothetical protein